MNLWPRPLQEPHPPVWVPSQGSRETIEWCAAKERKYTYLQTFSPLTLAQKNFDLYREIAANDGYEASASQLGWAVPTYVAETDEIARRELKPHMEAFFNRFLRFPIEMRLPPGYSSVASTKHLIETKFALRSTDQTIDTLIDLGMVICGSARTVREAFAHHQKNMGFGNLIAMMQIATQPAEQTEKSLRLFAADVAPHLRSPSRRAKRRARRLRRASGACGGAGRGNVALRGQVRS